MQGSNNGGESGKRSAVSGDKRVADPRGHSGIEERPYIREPGGARQDNRRKDGYCSVEAQGWTMVGFRVSLPLSNATRGHHIALSYSPPLRNMVPGHSLRFRVFRQRACMRRRWWRNEEDGGTRGNGGRARRLVGTFICPASAL